MSDLGAEYQAIDSRQSNNRFTNAGDKIGEKAIGAAESGDTYVNSGAVDGPEIHAALKAI